MKLINARGIEYYIEPPEPSLNKEGEVFDFIDSIPANGVFYDLGACQGVFSFYAALRGIESYSFEPEPLNFGRFQKLIGKNSELNKLVNSKLTAFMCGVGSHDHMATMTLGRSADGVSPGSGRWRYVLEKGWEQAKFLRLDIKNRLLKPGALNSLDTVNVEIVSLDSFIAKNNLPTPTHMKIDIDGNEALFIDGARRTFGSKELKAVIFELCKNDSQFGRIVQFLRSNGFKETSRHHIEDGLYNFVFSKMS